MDVAVPSARRSEPLLGGLRERQRGEEGEGEKELHCPISGMLCDPEGDKVGELSCSLMSAFVCDIPWKKSRTGCVKALRSFFFLILDFPFL